MTEDIDEIIQNEIDKKGDISEHLLTLKEYAKKCDHVTEFGVRWVCSTWALLAGARKKLVSYDTRPIDETKQELLNKISKKLNVDFKFIQQNVLQAYIEYTDLLFIDTIQSFKQLSLEFYIHGWKVRKYIIIHDTTTYEKEDECSIDTSCLSEFLQQYSNELPNEQGISPAIKIFLENNPEWEVEKIFTNNNGLTILKKNSFNNIQEDKWTKKENIKIDAIILTYTKDLNFYGLTQRTIQTMKNRNKSLNFNIVVVEGNVNAASHNYTYPETTTVVVDQKFNYNKFLNIGLQRCKNKYILICNNDILFLEDSVVNLIDYMEKNKILSACPQEPNWHQRFFTPEQLASESISGYRTMHEIAGWCICTTRQVIEKMGQFDEQFDLYYQDDDYAMFLKTNNIEHHLVNSSKVRHECSASLELVDRDIQELSAELKTKFINKWQAHL